MTVSPDYLRLLVDFNYWARDRALAAVATLTAEQYERNLGNSFASVRDTMNHIFFAEWIWYSRWQGNGHEQRPVIRDVPALREAWTAHEGRVRTYVSSLDAGALTRDFEYKTLAGVVSSSKLWETIVHLVNHGSYHRGQVTTMIRQIGAMPPASTDLITYFRERSSAA